MTSDGLVVILLVDADDVERHQAVVDVLGQAHVGEANGARLVLNVDHVGVAC